MHGLGVSTEDPMDGGYDRLHRLATADGKVELGSQEVTHHPQPLLHGEEEEREESKVCNVNGSVSLTGPWW